MENHQHLIRCHNPHLHPRLQSYRFHYPRLQRYRFPYSRLQRYHFHYPRYQTKLMLEQYTFMSQGVYLTTYVLVYGLTGWPILQLWSL